ncbi:putative reverse transcriptase domain-containing protein [Tanacetum coccineum]
MPYYSAGVGSQLGKSNDGHFTAVVKVLCSLGVAPFSTDTLTALLAKHPILPPPVIPGSLPSEPPLVVDVNSVLGSIQSFPKGTSCGRDGLRAQHILDALCGEGSAIAVGLLKAISVVVNLLLEGRCPKVLAEFVASAPLTPLLKPDNGIRPIAVGAIWRRLASKVAMRGVRKEMSKYLGDFQFGVGVPSGAEAVLHGANRFLNKFHSDGSLAMLTVDFSNAFNLVDRTTLLHEVRTRCPSISLWVDFLYGQSARLDVGDDHIWSTTGVQQWDPLWPLLFALVLHPLVHQIRDCCQLLFHAWYLNDGTIIGDVNEVAKAIDIIKAKGPRLGLELNIKKTEVFLAIMQWGEGEEWVVSPRLAGMRELLFASAQLQGVAKLLFGLRMCQPMYIREAVSIFDNGLRRAIEAIVDHILQGCGIDGADSDYGYALDRVRMSLPEFDLSGLGQHMSALEYRTILKYRLMIPLFPVDEPCPVCRKVCLDSFGEHAVHCKELPGFKYRHDLVRDVLYDVLKRAGISSKKEAPAEGKHACVDLTGVSPLVGLRDNGFAAGQATLKAKSSNVVKHEKTCLENQYVFIPFAFDTFGFLAPEAEEFFTRVQRVVQSNFSTPTTQNFIFSRIGFAIQKGVAAQLVARLPAILL